MKKTLLLLLALASSAIADTALTLSAEDVKLSNPSLIAGSTPRFEMQLGERMGESNLFEATYIFGSSDYSGTFSVYEEYPLLNENGQLELIGLMALDETSALQDIDFITWLGAPPQAVTVQLESPIILTIKAERDSDMGTLEREISGVYFTDNNSSVQLPEVTGGVYVTGTQNFFASFVPEPSTATLSLLALAGLCARRRRG